MEAGDFAAAAATFAEVDEEGGVRAWAPDGELAEAAAAGGTESTIKSSIVDVAVDMIRWWWPSQARLRGEATEKEKSPKVRECAETRNVERKSTVRGNLLTVHDFGP